MTSRILKRMLWLLLVAFIIQSCSKGRKDTPVVAPPKDTASTAPPKDTTGTQPPTDTTRTDTTVSQTHDTTITVSVADDIVFYEFTNHSYAEIDFTQPGTPMRVFINDGKQTTIKFVPGKTGDVPVITQPHTAQPEIYLQYSNPYRGTASTLSKADALTYDHWEILTVTGNAVSLNYTVNRIVPGGNWVPIHYSIRDGKASDMNKITSADFQAAVASYTYQLH